MHVSRDISISRFKDELTKSQHELHSVTDSKPTTIDRKLSDLLDIYKENSRLTRRSILLGIVLKEQRLRDEGIDPSSIKNEL